MNFRVSALATALLSLASATWAQQDTPKPSKKLRLLIGPQLGVFRPVSGRTRAAFGDDWVNIGLGLGPVAQPRAGGGLEFDINVFTSRDSRSRVVLAPLGVVYRRGQADTTRRARAYSGASANLLVANTRVDRLNMKSSTGTSWGGSVFGGLAMGRRAYVEARYYVFGKVRGFDFSGMNLAAGIRF